MKNELRVIPREHTVNLNKELGVLLEFLEIKPSRDKVAFGILLDLLDAGNRERGIKTAEVAKRMGITQAAAIYQVNKLVGKGFAQKAGSRYFLRGGNLEETMDEIKKDYLRKMERMKKVAKRMDQFIY